MCACTNVRPCVCLCRCVRVSVWHWGECRVSRGQGGTKEQSSSQLPGQTSSSPPSDPTPIFLYNGSVPLSCFCWHMHIYTDAHMSNLSVGSLKLTAAGGGGKRPHGDIKHGCKQKTQTKMIKLNSVTALTLFTSCVQYYKQTCTQRTNTSRERLKIFVQKTTHPLNPQKMSKSSFNLPKSPAEYYFYLREYVAEGEKWHDTTRTYEHAEWVCVCVLTWVALKGWTNHLTNSWRSQQICFAYKLQGPKNPTEASRTCSIRCVHLFWFSSRRIESLNRSLMVWITGLKADSLWGIH